VKLEHVGLQLSGERLDATEGVVVERIRGQI
jgi:hypothetical protein